MLTINLIESNGYENENLIKLKDALLIIEKVINSDAFKEKVKAFPFYFRNSIFVGHDIFYTNDEVYSMIMNAVEYPGNLTKGTMDLYLNLIEGSDGSVIGFGNPTEKEIYTYKVMFEGKAPKEIANHITHEWTHKLGFTHAKYATRWGKRNDSVPYAIGNIIEDLAN